MNKLIAILLSVIAHSVIFAAILIDSSIEIESVKKPEVRERKYTFTIVRGWFHDKIIHDYADEIEWYFPWDSFPPPPPPPPPPPKDKPTLPPRLDCDKVPFRSAGFESPLGIYTVTYPRLECMEENARRGYGFY